MASSLGIRVGQRRFEIVALEGSAKKPRITASVSGQIPGDVDDQIGATTAALKRAVKGLKLKGEVVHLSIDAGLAAYRTLTLPFDDQSKIESVLKFEVESQLPQWDIDDVVADFMLMNSTGVESQLLVTAVQKDELWGALQACEKAGFEAHEAELEVVSVINAAHRKGVFAVDGAEILVHVGESTTSLVVIDGGAVRSMRALHIGAFLPEESPPEAGEEQDREDDEPAAERGGAEPGEPQASGEAVEPLSPAQRQERLAAAATRVRREIVRTLTGSLTANPVDAIYLAGSELPGLAGESVEEVEIEVLDVIPEEAGEVEGERGVFAAAYGAALGALGGAFIASRLRREELRFSGKFERLELPLAVFSLLAVTVLLVQMIVIMEETKRRESDMQIWLKGSNNYIMGEGDKILDPDNFKPGRLENAPRELSELIESTEDPEADLSWDTSFESLQQIDRQLVLSIGKLERELGTDGEIEQPLSALEAATLVLGVLETEGPERVGRFVIRSVRADYRPSGGTRPDLVTVKLDMTFFGEGGDGVIGTGHYTHFQEVVESQPWCAGYQEGQTDPIDPGFAEVGVIINNIVIDVNPRLAFREPEGE